MQNEFVLGIDIGAFFASLPDTILRFAADIGQTAWDIGSSIAESLMNGIGGLAGRVGGVLGDIVGKVVGAVIGAFIMGVMNNGMSIMGIGIDWQQVIKGLVLLAAVCVDVYNKKK